MATTIVIGRDAITTYRDAISTEGMTLGYYASDVDDGQEGITLERAEEIAQEDPGLVYLICEQATAEETVEAFLGGGEKPAVVDDETAEEVAEALVDTMGPAAGRTREWTIAVLSNAID